MTREWRYDLVALPDGRVMEVSLYDSDKTRALVSLTGTPGGTSPTTCWPTRARRAARG